MATIKKTKKKVELETLGVTPKDMLIACLVKWPWFILSISICLASGILFLLRTPPVYERATSLLIKTEASSLSSEIQALSGMPGLTSMFQANNKLQDELITIQSPMTVEEVVSRLRLNIVYTTRQYLRDYTLYADEIPIDIYFIDLDDNNRCQFNFKLETNKYTISDLSSEKSRRKSNDKIIGVLNDTIKTPMGRIVIKPSVYNKKADSFECVVTHFPLREIANKYKQKLWVGGGRRGSSLVRIAIQDERAPRGDEFLNTLIQVYSENWVKEHNKTIKSTSDFIEQRLSIIGGDLGSVEEDITEYMSDNLVPSFETAAGTYFQQATAATTTLDNLTNQITNIRNIRSGIAGNDSYQLLPVSPDFPAEVSALISSYNTKILQRNNYIANSSATNPLVQDLDVELNTLKSVILHSIDNAIQSLTTRQMTTQIRQSNSNAKMASNPRKQLHLQNAERQQKVKEQIYLYLLEKREQNELSQAFSAYNTRMVNPPSGASNPEFPDKQMIMLIAFSIGFLLPAIIFILRCLMNNKVRGRKDVEILSAPFLGELPQSTDQKKSQKNRHSSHPIIDVKGDSKNVVNEAFRIVRTNLEFLGDEDSHPQVYTLNSLNVGSGKTYVAINLGASLALNDKKVCLIDCDIRKASLSRFVGRPKQGLSDYLRGKCTNLDTLLCKVEGFDNLQVLPVGVIPPNPVELLHGKRLEILIEELRKRYDFILLDCPPTEVVADAQIVNRVTDVSLFIIRVGIMDRPLLSVVEQYYRDDTLKNLAVILNGTEIVNNKYGYGAYGYGYGYGYTYMDKA